MTAPRLVAHEEDCPALCQEDYCAVPTHYPRGSATNDRHSYACTCHGEERLADSHKKAVREEHLRRREAESSREEWKERAVRAEGERDGERLRAERAEAELAKLEAKARVEDSYGLRECYGNR